MINPEEQKIKKMFEQTTKTVDESLKIALAYTAIQGHKISEDNYESAIDYVRIAKDSVVGVDGLEMKLGNDSPRYGSELKKLVDEIHKTLDEITKVYETSQNLNDVGLAV